ncbi:tRNA 2-selenouridine(34) synthase MnmH [Paenibacillus humicola]|uniref:tRNA 2-selenouridine(34) synthase MnmH n=1 Tax=Paenibacillus humicola TaxID=3110540 RepID=UPI00237B3B46|nr:tRNA 2-selenouridine(34) synthase MnmH [Paenibacillus humicola]
MFQDITIEELRELRAKNEITMIDVRSPSEFEDSTVPGSLNIPFFDDRERAEIGTLYKQTSVEAAKERGLEIASAKLPAFVKQFGQIKGRKAVFCWRGGMRSKTTATVLSLMGIHVYRLAGGFRAYRKWVVETLETFELNPPAYVIHGHTGTGKTEVLRRLKEEGYPVLDLEALAGHRGSIFGHVGLKANNQKTFDSLLLEELHALQHAPYILFEAESKRIGKVVMPEFLVRKKEAGTAIRLELPVDERVRQIMADYRPYEHPEAYLEAFRQIKSRIHTPIAAEIESCLEKERFEPAIRMLLEHYYDPRYSHTAEQYEGAAQIELKAATVEEAVQGVIEAIKSGVPL